MNRALACCGILAALCLAFPGLRGGGVEGEGPPCSEPAANCQDYSTENAFNSTGGGVFVTADDFTPSAGGSISGVCFWGAYVPDPNPDPTPPDDFTITYYRDTGQSTSSGFPGDVLARFTSADLTVAGPSETGDSTGGGLARIFEYHATHAAVPVTGGECYWVEIVNPHDGSAEWFWAWDTDATGNGWCVVDGEPPDGYDFSDVREGRDLAFCLDLALGDATAGCGPPGECGPDAGACDVENGTPGCEDPACCAAVCVEVPICCLVAWTQQCADVADDTGCLLQLPEPCEADQNCQVTDLLGHGGFNDDAAIGATSDLSFPSSVAENFTPALGGDLTGLCWWGFYFDFDSASDCSSAAVDDFTVTYYEDDGGLPGTVLASHAVTPTRTANGTILGGAVTVHRFDATHDAVAVAAGGCYWVEITNNLDGTCLWVWQTAPGGDRYSMQDLGDGYTVEDGENWDLAWCSSLPLADQAACAYPVPDEACPAGDLELTQSTDPDTITSLNSIVCMADSGGTFLYSLETAVARSYDLGARPDTAGLDLDVECVQLGVELNEGGAFTVTVNLYEDTDGGDPTAPGTDLDLLGAADVLVPAGVELAFMTATFEPPVAVPADTVLVVEIHQPSRATIAGGDKGGFLPGSNALGQSGPTYLRAADCSVDTYVDLADAGFPDMHLVQRVVATAGGEPCPWDCDGSGDGVVNVVDLLALLATWNQEGVPCDLGLGQPGAGIEEFLDMLANWGACP